MNISPAKPTITSLLRQLACLCACIVALLAITANREGKLLGYDLDSGLNSSTNDISTHRLLTDTLVVNTTVLGNDIAGFAGAVPLEVYILDGRIVRIEPLPNSETPRFFDRAKSVFQNYIGLTPQQGLAQEVDAVSGATFTSRAIIGNVREAMEYAAHAEIVPAQPAGPSAAVVAAIIVGAMAMTVPLVVRSKRYRILQAVLNVGVLGFWAGTFVSYAAMIGLAANGWLGWESVPVCLLLIAAFVYPLFGRHSYYCANVCPFGSLQELAAKTGRRKLPMSARTARLLGRARVILWAVLMFVMLTSAWFAWVDYDLFTAFIVATASWAVIAMAVIFVILSMFVPRPYCRFVCPTGTLLKFSEGKLS